MEHISFSQLTEYARDRMQDPAQRQQISAHITSCELCRQGLAVAWQIVQRTQIDDRADNSSAVPAPALMQRVLKAARLHSAHQAVTRLTASLLHDSRLDAARQGVRGSVTDRELLYNFGQFDLHLSIVPTEKQDSFTLMGQLMGSEQPELDIEGSRIELLRADLLDRTALVDNLGRFRLSRVPEGEYTLYVATDQIEVLVDPLAVQL